MKLKDQYASLTADERVVLYLRAIGREDEQEIKAVLNASPRIQLQPVDFSPICHALHSAHLFHSLFELDKALTTILLWNQPSDYSCLLAALSATQYERARRAWESIDERYGLDSQMVRAALASDLKFFSNAAFHKFLKKLAFSENECKRVYELDTKKVLPPLPTVEKFKHDYEQIISVSRAQLGG